MSIAPEPNERALRMKHLAEHLIDAADAMNREEWVSCQAKCASTNSTSKGFTADP